MSIAAQRRALQALADDRGLVVVYEYVDAVESGKDDRRPGFQEMLRALRDPSRQWRHLLVLDTSRIARRIFLAQAFGHQCERLGVSIVYAKMPDLDPITRVIVESVFQAMDQVHSMISREKGLAGMRENVLRGFRAGGRAPLGYRLEAVETGAVRDGRPVRKTRLVPDGKAKAVGRYLRARAAGLPRARAKAKALLSTPDTTLCHLEWNALAYAGATCWNVHAERGTGRRRRPREEWVVQPGTHEALITRAEAEAILAQMESSPMRRVKLGQTKLLLSGLLYAPDGTPWLGNGGEYRIRRDGARKGRLIKAEGLDAAILAQIERDLQAPRFVRALVTATRKRIGGTGARERRQLESERAALDGKIRRTMELGREMENPAPALREIEALERRRQALEAELADIEMENAHRSALAQVDEGYVKRLLRALAGQIDRMDHARARDVLPIIIDKIVLDPTDLDLRIHYRISLAGGMEMASPRGSADDTTLRLVRLVHHRRTAT